MKKSFLFLLLAMFVTMSSCCKGDEPIKVSELPKSSQQFLNQYFSDLLILKVTKDFDSYEVDFTNGYKLEFDKKGAWTEVDCKNDVVPNGIVPTAILTYVQMNYANAFIVKIEHDRHGYETELNSGLNLEFDSNGKFIRIDD